jgi:hypothetical protein
MIEHGPVDVIVVAAGEPRFNGVVLAELQRQAEIGTIRVLDAMIIVKEDEGRCWTLNIEDLEPEEAKSLGFIETGTRGLFDSDDEATLMEGMVPGSAVVALAIEHTWAIALVNAFDQAGVEMALNFRVPAPIVDEAFASLGTGL